MDKLKYAIVLLIIIFGFYLGNTFKNKYKKRVDTLSEFVNDINKMIIYLKYNKLPTYQLVESLSKNSKLPIFKLCNKYINENEIFPISYNKALDECKTSLNITNSDYNLLISVSDILGEYDAANQINALEALIELLNQNISIAKKENDTDGKMYQAVCSLGSIAVGILII